ncbi:hypothetical protein D4764_0186370 [Takifugu flavidus]|uniref:NOD1/2 winged helix domain-containing protein n=1 Tax=Takifugu flavidus TaxID=433684 RepID=A0A5C6ME55_9TELE|nr:hypothetical protein D4764_0186370 [Takifugu flavidus]
MFFSGLSVEVQPNPSKRTGPELQPSWRCWNEAALCCSGGSRVEPGGSQSTPKNKRGDGKAPQWSPESCEMIPILAKLAFKQLQKGNVIFYESDLRDCGITVRSADAYSGVFTQMFRRSEDCSRRRCSALSI